MEKPTIGFIILAWNSENVLDNCLNSIVHLKSINPLAIIVDNGSQDSTLKIIKQYKHNYPENISWIHFGYNTGTTVSRNAALGKLKNKGVDYYCILDSDTKINDDAIGILIKELVKHSSYGLVGPKMVTSSGTIQMSARAFPTLIEKILKALPFEKAQAKGEEMEALTPPNKEIDSYPVDYLMSACWLIKPETIEKAGMLDENIFYAPEDAEYCIRIWKAGYKVAFCPKAVIIHEWQRISKKKFFSKMNWLHIKGLLYMFLKHRYFLTTAGLKKHFYI